MEPSHSLTYTISSVSVGTFLPATIFLLPVLAAGAAKKPGKAIFDFLKLWDQQTTNTKLTLQFVLQWGGNKC